MSALEEQWLQDIAESLGIPALSPTIVKMVLPVVEAHIKKIAQQAHKFQRRSKSTIMSVNDINSALSMNKLEPVYGLSRSEHVDIFTTPPTDADGAEKPAATKSAGNKKMINLVEFGKNSTIVPCPLKPEVNLHWLAVNGNQPLTADNPSVVTAEPEQQTMLLAKELQHLYARIVGIILSSSSSGPTVGLPAVLTVLRTDAGIQELAPYLSRCFYQQIRANSKRLVLLRTIIAAIRAMLGNPAVDLEFHLQQLMPALFTCVVAAKLSSSPSEDHWALRTAAAEAIATIGTKYSAQFPELHARMCKTYLEALGPDRSFGTLYGAIVGLSSLGNHTVRSLLLPNLPAIQERLNTGDSANSSVVKAEGSGQTVSKRKRGASFDTTSEKVASNEGTDPAQRSIVNKGKYSAAGAAKQVLEQVEVNMCKEALLRALGQYMVHSLRLPALGQLGIGFAARPSQSASSSFATTSVALCDLEEALVPYYASASKQDYHCRLFI